MIHSLHDVNVCFQDSKDKIVDFHLQKHKISLCDGFKGNTWLSLSLCWCPGKVMTFLPVKQYKKLASSTRTIPRMNCYYLFIRLHRPLRPHACIQSDYKECLKRSKVVNKKLNENFKTILPTDYQKKTYRLIRLLLPFNYCEILPLITKFPNQSEDSWCLLKTF